MKIRMFVLLIMTCFLAVVANDPVLAANLEDELEKELGKEIERSFQNETKQAPRPAARAVAPAVQRTPQRNLASPPKAAPTQAVLPASPEVRGAALVHAKKFDDAIQLLFPMSDRLSRSGLISLARAYAGKNETLNELKTLQLAVRKNPKDYHLLTLQGESLARAKRSEESIASYQEARSINKKYQPAAEGLLRELERIGDHYEARTLLHDMIASFGEVPRFYSHLCRLYSMNGFISKALEVCQIAIQKDPGNPENHVQLVATYKNKQEPDQAKELINSAAKRFPAAESVQTAAAEIHLENQDFVAAYKHYKQAASADPKSARAHLGLASTSFELQKNDEALRAYSEACRLDRKNTTKSFQTSINVLRRRKDMTWQGRFEEKLGECLSN